MKKKETIKFGAKTLKAVVALITVGSTLKRVIPLNVTKPSAQRCVRFKCYSNRNIYDKTIKRVIIINRHRFDYYH